MNETTRRLAHRATGAFEADERLDAPAYQVTDGPPSHRHPTGTAAKPIQNALRGTWLGHPLHPIVPHRHS